MALALIWLIAALAYVAFYSWYVGFKRRLSADEVEAFCCTLESIWSADRIAPVKTFLSRDSGRDFYMVNLVNLRAHTASGESGKAAMQRYQKPFLKGILKRACHPIAVGIAASHAVECWGIANGEAWTVAAFVRYRSRRDLAEILLTPSFHAIHLHKEAAVDKTIAFASDPAFIVGGGPKVVVPLLLLVAALMASLLLG